MPASPSLPSALSFRLCGRVLLLVLLVVSVSSARAATGLTSAGDADGSRRYPLTGEIVSADAARNTLVVRHEAVAGFMPPMTMEFSVGPGDAAIARPGTRIRGELVEVKPGDYRLEKIWPDELAPGPKASASPTALAPAGALPRLPLLDQDGKVVEVSSFRGRSVVLNFIYSRCPFANMCPLATRQMMNLQEEARQLGIRNLQLISITLDPEYDTPGVLHAYAHDRGIDTSNFSFLTGPLASVESLLKQFGVETSFAGGVLQHSLVTVLFDADGRIIHRTTGSQWDPAEFLKRLPRP